MDNNIRDKAKQDYLEEMKYKIYVINTIYP